MPNFYELLQEMLQYHNRAVIALTFSFIFYGITVISGMVHDIKYGSKCSYLSIIFYSSSFGLSLLMMLMIVSIATGDEINKIVQFLSISISLIIMAGITCCMAADTASKK